MLNDDPVQQVGYLRILKARLIDKETGEVVEEIEEPETEQTEAQAEEQGMEA